MLDIRYTDWNGMCEVSPSGQFSLLYWSFRENDVIILTHKFSRKYFGLPLESSSTPLGVWEKDGHVAGKQLLYQESTDSVWIGRIFQTGKQAFKNLEATLGPDIARKYVITFFLLSTTRNHITSTASYSCLPCIIKLFWCTYSKLHRFPLFSFSSVQCLPPGLPDLKVKGLERYIGIEGQTIVFFLLWYSFWLRNKPPKRFKKYDLNLRCLMPTLVWSQMFESVL